jgi:hypothetical protein
LRRGLRLDGAQVAARSALRVRLHQRRLADEQIGVSGDPGQSVAGTRVSRIADHGPVGAGAEAEGEQVVVQDAMRRDLEPGRLEGLALGVLVHVEGPLEHLRPPEPLADRAQQLATIRWHP